MGKAKRRSMLLQSVKRLTGDSLEPGSWRTAWVIRQEGRERQRCLYSPGLRGHCKCFARRKLLLNIPCIKDQEEKVVLAHSVHVGVSIRTEAKG